MSLIERINTVQQIIRQTEFACQRAPGSVTLLAVSKGHTSEDIELAHSAGLNHFGENYLQEALVKIAALSSRPICWHYIGSIQTNKTQAIALNFAWVQSVCRKEIAMRLSKHRPSHLPPLNVCIQVNIDNAQTKSGIAPNMVANLISDIRTLPNLHLRGLMVIPTPASNEQQYLTFLRVTKLLHDLNTQFGLTMDTLSMGMSDDLQAAICAGSTMVRVGRGIFGERPH